MDAHPLQLDAAVRDLLDRGVALEMGSARDEMQPEISRVWGRAWDTGAAELSVLLPLPAGAPTLSNLQSAPAMALAFARPTDYASFQLKGRLVAQRDPSAEDWRRARAHFDAFLAEFPQVGLEPATYSPWFPVEGITLVVRVERAVHPTPGSGAGAAL